MQKPGVPVRADEGSHHDPHGLHPQRDRQRLLSLLQVSSTILIKNLLIDFNTRSMFRNVVASMNEALDISMHLKPLASHFQVFNFFAILTRGLWLWWWKSTYIEWHIIILINRYLWPRSVSITISMMFSHHRQWRLQSSTSSDLCLHQCYTPWVEKDAKIKLSKRLWRHFLSGLPRLLDQRVLQLAGPYHHSHDGLDWCFNNEVILQTILLDSRSLTGGLQSSDRPSSQVSRPRNYFPDRGPVKSSFLSILLFNRGSFQKRQLNLTFFPFQVSIFLK